MASQPDHDLFVASLTIAEIWRGILALPSGKKRGGLEAWFTGKEGPPSAVCGANPVVR